MKIDDLRVENERNPLLVNTRCPRFGWKLESDGTSVRQSAYRLQVSMTESFDSPFWDSGKVSSEESRYVPYTGPELECGVRYFVRVRVTDRSGGECEWSSPEFFETAPFPIGTWPSPFIGTETDSDASSSRSVRLRKEFTVQGGVLKARLYATALGLYELSLNGQRVGTAVLAPGWSSYRKRLLYQACDVTALLREGENVIGVELGTGWFKGNLVKPERRNFYGRNTAFSLVLFVTDKTGHKTCLLTDRTWKGAGGPTLYAELYHGETYDARLEQRGWNAPRFEDRSWKPSRVVPFDASVVVPQDGPPVSCHERLTPVGLFRTPSGERVLDFGQNLTGWVSFSVNGNRGERVVLRHAEVLDAKGNFYVKNLRSAKQRIEYILSGQGEESYEPHFSFQGFRYVRIDEYPGTPDPASFQAVVVHSHMEPALEFECSNTALNRLHQNIFWGWKGNSVDIPSDCPQRDERLGWTGDAQVFIGTASYLMDGYAFFRKWLRDLACDQRSDGGVPFVIPDVLSPIAGEDTNITATHSSTGWGDAAVVCPWTLYERYGDRRLLAEHYPSMKAWVEYIRARAEGGVLWTTGFHFGDWLALDAREGSFFGATPNDFTATACYSHSVELVAKAAEVLGFAEDEETYRLLHTDIRRAFRSEFFTPGGRLACRTQTAYVLALVFGLVPREHRKRAMRELSALIRENGGRLTTGFLGTPHICRALSENGRLSEAYDLLLREEFPSWLYQVHRGATTIWEHWDGIKPDGRMLSPRMNSFNHYVYGAVGEWIYRTVGGIAGDPESPGFRSFLLHPRPGGGISWCRCLFHSPYGRIRCEWRIENSVFSLEIEIPVNTTARIIIDGAAPEDISATGGLVFRFEEGESTAEAGSGQYRVSCPVRMDGMGGEG